jgi:hypothetical protein
LVVTTEIMFKIFINHIDKILVENDSFK